MNKIKRHIMRWNGWQKHNCNGKLHKILVLLGIIKSPTFGLYLLPDELPNYNNIFYGEEMYNSETYEQIRAICGSLDLEKGDLKV